MESRAVDPSTASLAMEDPTTVPSASKPSIPFSPVTPEEKSRIKELRRKMAGIKSSSIEDIQQIWCDVLGVPSGGDDEDFFLAGGDVNKLHALQERIHDLTAYRFKTEVFLTRPTLRGLSEQLGISFQDSFQPGDNPDLLTFRLVRRAIGSKKGCLLSMPGLDGHAVGGSYAKSGILPDHDLWACEARSVAAVGFDPAFWPQLARQIADRIAADRAPRCQVVVGYSMAGYIAWLVARMLMGTDCEIARVVTIDTPPMHCTKRDRTPALMKLLSTLPALSTPMLDIRRAAPKPFVPAEETFSGWQVGDGPVITLSVDTPDHDDMIRPHLLRRMADPIEFYIEHGALKRRVHHGINRVQSFSGEVFRLVRTPDCEATRKLVDYDSKLDGKNATLFLAFFCMLHLPPRDARKFLQLVLQSYPSVPAIRYAKMLLNFAALCTGQGSRAQRATHAIEIPSKRAYELALLSRTPGAILPPSLLRAFLYVLAWTVTYARSITRAEKLVWLMRKLHSSLVRRMPKL